MLKNMVKMPQLTNGLVQVPKVKLNDGNEMPAIALGTWLGFGSKLRSGKAGNIFLKIFSIPTGEVPRPYRIPQPNNTASKQFCVPGVGILGGGFGSALVMDFMLQASIVYHKERIEPKSSEVEQAVRWALDAGYNHIDTAWIYKIEDQVGRGLKGVPRENVFVTSKLWNSFHAKNDVVPALRESLRSLQLDYIDLYLIHWPIGQFANSSYDTTDYLETWKGMIEAKKLGLTKSIGLSNFNQKMIERIIENGLEKPAALQVELNLNLQQPELVAYCKSQDIVIMAYTPFGSLFYSKAAPGAPPPRVDDPALVKIAEKYNKTVPQIALRYLVELGAVPLPKSLTKSRIEQNIDIFDFQLTEDEKNLLKTFDKGYRVIPQYKWQDHPFYPFEKKVNK